MYVRLSIAEPEILPTMLDVLDRRQGDREFLRIFCRACVEARAYDESAHEAAEWLLAMDPAAAEAHIVMATRLLQAPIRSRS